MQTSKKTLFGAGLAAILFSIFAFKLVEFSIFGGLFSFGDVELNINIGSYSEPKSTSLISTKKPNTTQPAILKTQTVTSEAQQTCQNQKSDYSCKRIALLLAERDLAEKVQIAITAQSTLENGKLTQDEIHSETQAIIANRTVIFEGYDAENNFYSYRLEATVGSN